MTRLGAFLRLAAARQHLLVLALALTLGARLGLWVESFRPIAALFDRVPKTNASGVSTADVRWAVRVAASQVPGTGCLTKALVAQTLCRRYGHPADLYVGVEQGGSAFAAHSWVESRGEVVVGDDVDLDRYETLGVLGS